MVEIISEVGINHQGDLNTALRLIDAAVFADADWVKFQKRDPDICVPDDQKLKPKQTPWGEMSYIEYKHRMEFGPEEYTAISDYCHHAGIGWFVSVWDENSAEFALRYSPEYIKIPSAKLTDIHLIRMCAESSAHVILSTGMSTVDEIDTAESVLRQVGGDGSYTLMHCHSAYPAPHEELSLSTIQTLKDRYLCRIGYSGHEFGIEPTVWAVALGAEVIERHITLDHAMWGSDHAASVEPHAFHKMVQRIRSCEQALGDGEVRVWDSETPALEKLRGVSHV